MNFSKIKNHLIILVIYTFLTLFMTYPVISNITTHIAGDGGDGWQNVWNMWWVNKAMLENKDIYYTDYQFYPIGVSLTFHTLTLYNTLLSVPLQMIFNNMILVYNILFLLSFILAGYGMFLLVSYLVKHKCIAIVSGIAYAFSPYHFAQGLGHLNLLSIQWIPFYIMFLIKTVNEKNIKNPILAGFFLALVSLSSWQYMVSSLIFTLLFLIYVTFSKKQKILNKLFLKGFILFVLVFVIIISPFAYPMINEFLSNDYMKSNYLASFSFITPSNYILPSPFHLLFEESIRQYYPVNLSDSVVFLGYTVSIIVLYFLIKNYKKIKLWVFSAFLFFILSLNSNTAFFGFLTPIHNFFHQFFPFFSVINNMERFAVMVMISFIVIFSFGLKDIILRLKKTNAKYSTFLTSRNILILVSLLIIFEFCPVIYYTTNADIPAILYEIEHNNEKFTILDIPPLFNSRSLYFQTIHNKKILGGYISRISPSSIEELKELERSINSGDVKKVFDIVEEHNIRYIIFYNYWSSHNNIDLRNLPEMLSTTKVFENEEIIIYEIKRN